MPLKDTSITDFDYFLGRAVSSGIQAYSSSQVSWTGLVPQDLPSGDYYLGWIIDADDEVPESNEGNNHNYFTSSLLSVTHLDRVRIYHLSLQQGIQRIGREQFHQRYHPVRSAPGLR